MKLFHGFVIISTACSWASSVRSESLPQLSDAHGNKNACDSSSFDESGECQSSLVIDQNVASVAEDMDLNCSIKAHSGECYRNPEYMFKMCLPSCMAMNDLGSKSFIESFGDFDGDCEDFHEPDEEDDSVCEDYVVIGECRENPDYMLEYCAKSCLVCIPNGTETFDIGVPQAVVQNDFFQQTLDVIQETAKYMRTEVMKKDEYILLRTLCRNYRSMCSLWAAQGKCEDESDKEYMVHHCGPACQNCDLWDEYELPSEAPPPCDYDESSNIFQSGDLDRMFERIVGERVDGNYTNVKPHDYTVKILSRPTEPTDVKLKGDYFVGGPWIIEVLDFVSPEECDRLIALGAARGYRRSTIEDDQEDETTGELILNDDTYRTSLNAWCEGECFSDPLAQRVIQRISDLTGVPQSYSEYLQLLQYSPGQYYRVHHDNSYGDSKKPDGPRILTVFLYLNDVEEGGATRFTDIGGGTSIDVQPRRGSALIWPSVRNDDPSQLDERTYHEALEVIKGMKYGANAWLHLRDFKNTFCDEMD